MIDGKPTTPSAVETIPSCNEGVSALASANAPFLFFDLASAWSVRDGVVRVTLESSRDMITASGLGQDFAVVCHLRMGLAASRQLLKALQDAEKYAAEVDRLRDEAAKPGASPPTIN